MYIGDKLNRYFESNKHKLLDALLPLMAESKSYNTKIDELVIVKRDNPEFSEICLQQPALLFSVQGEKRLTAGSEIIEYQEGQIVFQGAPMPCSSYIAKASKDTPYVAMLLSVNIPLMTELILSINNVGSDNITHSYSSLGKIEAGSELVDAFGRLANLLSMNDSDIKVLSPLIIKEIYYFLLKTDLKEKIISFAVTPSCNNKILKTISYLKENYNKHFSINELADMANMSPATFHRHFKIVTTLSPIQYQKTLRLLEASRIIQYENASVSEAAFKVGYESVSQFTREYKRMFNVTPKNKQQKRLNDK